MQVQYLDTGKLKVKTTSAIFWVILLLGNSTSIITLILTIGEARINCQRLEQKQGNCQLVRSSLMINEKQNFKLSDLKTAEVVRSNQPDQETGNYNYGVALRLWKTQNYLSKFSFDNDIKTPFTLSLVGSFSAQSEMNEIANQINQFITNPEVKTIDIRNRVTDSILPVITGWFILTLIFATIIGSECYSNCVFDRNRNCFTLTRKRWLRIYDVVEHSLDEITAIDIETSDTGMGNVHRINIKLNSGEDVPLIQRWYSSDYRKTVVSIQQFLNLNH
jgi:hypothetical protein